MPTLFGHIANKSATAVWPLETRLGMTWITFALTWGWMGNVRFDEQESSLICIHADLVLETSTLIDIREYDPKWFDLRLPTISWSPNENWRLNDWLARACTRIIKSLVRLWTRIEGATSITLQSKWLYTNMVCEMGLLFDIDMKEKLRSIRSLTASFNKSIMNR